MLYFLPPFPIIFIPNWFWCVCVCVDCIWMCICVFKITWHCSLQMGNKTRRAGQLPYQSSQVTLTWPLLSKAGLNYGLIQQGDWVLENWVTLTNLLDTVGKFHNASFKIFSEGYQAYWLLIFRAQCIFSKQANLQSTKL